MSVSPLNSVYAHLHSPSVINGGFHRDFYHIKKSHKIIMKNQCAYNKYPLCVHPFCASPARKLAYLYRLPTNEHKAKVGLSWLLKSTADAMTFVQANLGTSVAK